jgi:hypothetical protein
MDKTTPIDQMVEAFWNLCDEDYWWFEFAYDQWWLFAGDQWWLFAAACPHHPGEFGRDKPIADYMWWAHSHGAIDLSTAILNVYEQAQTAHELLRRPGAQQPEHRAHDPAT